MINPRNKALFNTVASAFRTSEETLEMFTGIPGIKEELKQMRVDNAAFLAELAQKMGLNAA
jgi:hypothetical protein